MGIQLNLVSPTLFGAHTEDYQIEMFVLPYSVSLRVCQNNAQSMLSKTMFAVLLSLVYSVYLCIMCLVF